MNSLLVKFDYLKYKYGHLGYHLNLDINTFPSKRLVKYCFEKKTHNNCKKTYEAIAHSYVYGDKDFTKNIEFIHTIYGTCTRERVRQFLSKFIREYYR